MKMLRALTILLALCSMAAAQSKVQKSFSITVNPALAIATTSLPAGQIGVAYSAQVAATGGAPPYTFTLLTVSPYGSCGTGPFGALPAGLVMSSAGAITGTPTTAGSFPLCVQVTDSFGAAAQMRFPAKR